MNTVEHYDKLIDEDNDPVRDSDILKEYMDKWDGKKFIDENGTYKSERKIKLSIV